MKKISIAALLTLFVSSIFANSYQIDFDRNEEMIQINQNDHQRLSMNITFDGIESFDVHYPRGKETNFLKTVLQESLDCHYDLK